jgi:hypothetical protein
VTYRFTAELWEYPAEKASWFFLTLPTEVADEIEAAATTSRRGFGSVRVSVTVGSTTWATSIFPSREAGSYLLPVKKAVRVAEGIDAGDPVEVEVDPRLE